MSDRFVTVATFGNLVEAAHCRALLEAAGLRAVLCGEETSSVLGLPLADWAAVKLDVPEESVEQALRLLAEAEDPGEEVDEAPPPPRDAITTTANQEIASTPIPGGWHRGRAPAPPAGAITDEPSALSAEEAQEEAAAALYLSEREALADRVVALTVICWLVPLAFHVVPLAVLLRIWCSSEPIRPGYLRKTYLAAALNPIFWVLAAVLVATITSYLIPPE